MSEPLDVVPPGALIDKLDAALDALGGPDVAALATDGDGTLWTGDVGEALFETMLRDGWIGEAAHEALLAELRSTTPTWDGTTPPPDQIARTLYAMYLRSEYPEDRVCAMMTWCMAGAKLSAIDEVCTSMLQAPFDLKKRLIPEAGHVLKWAHGRKIPIWLVSASPRVVVERAAAIAASSFGIDVPAVLAMNPKLEDGVIRPGIVGTWTYGEGKLEALSAALAVEQRNLVCAMGDNVFDGAMLRAACVPIAIRPKPALVKVASTIPGLVRAEMMT